MAEFLISLTQKDSPVKIDDRVIDFLQLNEYKKRGYNLFLAGVAYSIYSDNSDCELYCKKKLMK